MKKACTLVLALVVLSAAGCGEITGPADAADAAPQRRDAGAYIGAGYNAAPDSVAHSGPILVGSGH